MHRIVFIAYQCYSLIQFQMTFYYIVLCTFFRNMLMKFFLNFNLILVWC